MKKYFIFLIAFTSAASVFAQQAPVEVETCYALDVPPLIAIGNAPAKRVYAQFSISKDKETNQIVENMVKIISPDTGIGMAMYAASSCELASESAANCTTPFMGSGTVQIDTSAKKISFQKMKLALEKSTIATMLLGSVKDLKLTDMTCADLRKILGL